MLLFSPALACRIRILSSLLVLLGLSTACGRGFDTDRVKDYRLALVNNNEASWKKQFSSLINDFNRYAGMTVLSFSEDINQANSAIVITEGLKERDQKVGWGQWITETKSENNFGKFPGETPKRVVSYSMRVEFDAKYFRDRMQTVSTKNTYEMQKLFFHEVGHGLEMDHVQDKSDVMYENVEGDKDFDRFFRQVRSYMADQ